MTRSIGAPRRARRASPPRSPNVNNSHNLAGEGKNWQYNKIAQINLKVKTLRHRQLWIWRIRDDERITGGGARHHHPMPRLMCSAARIQLSRFHSARVLCTRREYIRNERWTKGVRQTNWGVVVVVGVAKINNINRAIITNQVGSCQPIKDTLLKHKL